MAEPDGFGGNLFPFAGLISNHYETLSSFKALLRPAFLGGRILFIPIVMTWKLQAVSACST